MEFLRRAGGVNERAFFSGTFSCRTLVRGKDVEDRDSGGLLFHQCYCHCFIHCDPFRSLRDLYQNMPTVYPFRGFPLQLLDAIVTLPMTLQ